MSVGFRPLSIRESICAARWSGGRGRVGPDGRRCNEAPVGERVLPWGSCRSAAGSTAIGNQQPAASIRFVHTPGSLPVVEADYQVTPDQAPLGCERCAMERLCTLRRGTRRAATAPAGEAVPRHHCIQVEDPSGRAGQHVYARCEDRGVSRCEVWPRSARPVLKLPSWCQEAGAVVRHLEHDRFVEWHHEVAVQFVRRLQDARVAVPLQEQPRAPGRVPDAVQHRLAGVVEREYVVLGVARWIAVSVARPLRRGRRRRSAGGFPPAFRLLRLCRAARAAGRPLPRSSANCGAPSTPSNVCVPTSW